MPGRQGQIPGAQFIGAAVRQPVKFLELVAGQPDAIGDMKFAVAIVAAPRLLEIEQFAGDIGHVNLTVVFIFGFQQAAFAAAVAQSLPLPAIKRFERRFPERLIGL